MTDCGQAMFNDVGVVAVGRPLPDGTTEAGFRVFIAGGLGANPHPAQALEEFTPREELLPPWRPCCGPSTTTGTGTTSSGPA